MKLRTVNISIIRKRLISHSMDKVLFVTLYRTRPVEQEICFSLHKTGGGESVGSCATLHRCKHHFAYIWRQWHHWQSFYCEHEIVVRFACLNGQMVLNGSHEHFFCSINKYFKLYVFNVYLLCCSRQAKIAIFILIFQLCNRNDRLN